MSSLPPPTKTAIPAWKWWAVLMMLLATVVNYMDRQALGSMASFIKGGQVPCLSGPGRRPALHSEYTGLTDALDRIPDSAGVTLEAEWVKHLMTAALERVKRLVSPRQYQMFDLHVLQKLPVQGTARTVQASLASVYMAKCRLGALPKKEGSNLKCEQ